MDPAESPKRWGSESPNKNWIDPSESPGSDSSRRWDGSPNSPKQWAKTPEVPHQKTWIKIPTLPDVNSPRKWETIRRSTSPETPVRSWLPSPHGRLESPKPHWLNVPRPDSPKQHWPSKPENQKTWVPINLPKVSLPHKNWPGHASRRSDQDLLSEWNCPSQRNSESFSNPRVQSPKIWLSPNHKRPNSPSWFSSSHKRSESPKTWLRSPEKPSENSANQWSGSKNGLDLQFKKSNEEEKNETRSCPSPKSWSSNSALKIQQGESSSNPKHLWVVSPENALESKSAWNENIEIKRETNTPTFIKTPIWPK